jgi:hypothetical protein
MDRLKTHIAFSFDISLWTFEEGQLLFITRGVKTRGSKSVSVQNLYRGHIYGLVQTKFDMKLRNITEDVLWESLCLYHRCVDTCIEGTFMD